VNCRPEFGAGFCLLQIVHPQKRRDARNALEACIGRLLEIKGVSHVNQMNLMLAIIYSTKNVHLWNSNRIRKQHLSWVFCSPNKEPEKQKPSLCCMFNEDIGSRIE